MKRIVPLALSGLSLLAMGQALAHAHFNPSHVAPGYAGTMAIQIGHGCSGSPTERLTLYVPSQVTVTPVAKPNWQVSSSQTRGKVTQVVWSGHSLASNQKDEFAFDVVAPQAAGVVAMAVKQECANGEMFWQEAGPNTAFPVPTFLVSADVLAGEDDDHHDHDHDHDHDHHDHDHHGHAH